MKPSVFLLSALVAASTALPLTVPVNQTSHICQPKTYTTLLFPGFNDSLPNYVEVKINSQPYLLLLDTGSPDTFLYADNVTCVSPAYNEQPQSDCTFGRTLGEKLDYIDDVVFNQSYASGMTVAGRYSMVDFEMAGLKFRQQIGVALRSTRNSYPAASGILGLAPRTAEGAYFGTSFVEVDRTAVRFYPTVFETMYNVTKQVTGVFSLAIQRGPTLGGYLTFGGRPPVNSTVFTPVKFQGLRNIEENQTVTVLPSTSLYPVQPDGIELNGKYSTSTYSAMIDSGAPNSVLPKDLFDQIAGLYNPPAKADPTYPSVYGTLCNATVPSIGLKLGGETFYFNEKDLLAPTPRADLCTIPFNPLAIDGKPGLQQFIIGNQFLKNVVAEFDVIKQEVRLASHNYTVNTLSGQ